MFVGQLHKKKPLDSRPVIDGEKNLINPPLVNQD